MSHRPDPADARTVPQLLTDAAAAWPHDVAIEDGDGRLTFSQLADTALVVARALAASGVGPGDRVALQAPNGHRWVLAALAVHLNGAILVPLSTRMKGPETGYILRASGARLLLTVEELAGARFLDLLSDEELPELERCVLLEGSSEGAISWERWLATGDAIDESEVRARAAAVDGDAISDLMFTSGTTGRPKGVMTSHAQNLSTFRIWSGQVGLGHGDRYLIVNPFFHAFGYKAGWLSCLLRGAIAIPHRIFDAEQVLARIATERITVLPGPPALYLSMLASPQLGATDLSTLRLAVTGAATIPVSLIERLRSELGFDSVLTAYGLTETCGVVSICQADDDPVTIATTSGRAIPGLEVRCVDVDGREVDRGEPGEIVVRGENVMKGYYRDEEQTALAIDAEGWLHTGDIGVMDPRGYLRITDRLKDMFTVGGFNVYPAEVENQLAEHDAVAQSAVVGVPDARLGEVPMAFVVRRPGTDATAEALVAWCRERMSNYKVPRRIAWVEALPLNASGKVQKFVLRERARTES